MTLKQLLTDSRSGLLPKKIKVIIQKRKAGEVLEPQPKKRWSFAEWCKVRRRARELDMCSTALVEHALATRKAVQELVRQGSAERPRSCDRHCGCDPSTSGEMACGCFETKLWEFCCSFVMLKDEFDFLSDFAGDVCNQDFGDQIRDGRPSDAFQRVMLQADGGKSTPSTGPADRTDGAPPWEALDKELEAKLAATKQLAQLAAQEAGA